MDFKSLGEFAVRLLHVAHAAERAFLIGANMIAKEARRVIGAYIQAEVLMDLPCAGLAAGL